MRSEKVSIPSASGIRRMRDILAVRFLKNRDRQRLFRVRMRAPEKSEEVEIEGIPSTSAVTDPCLKFTVPGIGTFRLEWDHILALQEIQESDTEERTTEPDLPFTSDWKLAPSVS